MPSGEGVPGGCEYCTWETQPIGKPAAAAAQQQQQQSMPQQTATSADVGGSSFSDQRRQELLHAAGSLLGRALTAVDGSEYLLFLPPGWAGKDSSHPVMLFLHGRGGVKNEDNIRGQSLTRMLTSPEFAQSCPFIVLTPIAQQPGWQPQFPSVLALLEMAVRDLGGDSSRLYCTGQSMGGNGCWHLAAENPGLFAAIAPVCGYVVEPPKPPKRKKKKKKKNQFQAPAPQPEPCPEPEPEPPWEQTPPPMIVRQLRGEPSSGGAAVPAWVFHSADDSVVPGALSYIHINIMLSLSHSTHANRSLSCCLHSPG